MPQPAAKSAMMAWFKSEDAGPDWKSAVGKWQGRVTKGSVSRKIESGNGAGRPVTYISGDTGAGYDFGKIMTSDYSICSVTRYLGGSKGRILQTNSHNWLHGHWHGRAGVAHYDTWVTPHEGPDSTDWLVMLGSPAVPFLPILGPALFRHKRITNTKQGTRTALIIINDNGTGLPRMCGSRAGVVFKGQARQNIATRQGAVHADFHLFVNEGVHELSDFGVMEVIVWNRALTEDEMWASMEYLNWKIQAPEACIPTSAWRFRVLIDQL